MGRSQQADDVRRLIDYLEEPVLLWRGDVLESANRSAQELFGLPEQGYAGCGPSHLLEPPPAAAGPGQVSPILGRLRSGPQQGLLLRGVCVGLGGEYRAWVCTGQASLVDLGSLTAGLIHNLAGPLSVIRSTAELVELCLDRARRRVPALAQEMERWPSSARDGLRTLLNTVDQITRATRDLLAKMHAEAARRYEPLDLNQILQREVRFAEDNLGLKQKIERRLELDPALPPIWGLYSDFSQSFRNLLRNAVQAMEGCERRCLRVATAWRDGEVVVEVEDTGVGIPPQDRERIFEPFFTTRKGDTGSAGLGLYSVRQLLEPYGVRFQVDSRPGRTVFTLRIPFRGEGRHA
jgi:signal transduction histidine kinase